MGPLRLMDHIQAVVDLPPEERPGTEIMIDHDAIYIYFIYIYGTWRNLLFFPVCFCGYKFVRCDLRLCTSNEFDATLIEETLWQG
jgi:hypothetical protein